MGKSASVGLRCFAVSLIAVFLSYGFFALPSKGFAKSFFFPIEPYAGADYRLVYQNNNIPYLQTSNPPVDASIDRSSLMHAFNVHAGVRLGSFLGAELGFYDVLPVSGETPVAMPDGSTRNLSARLSFYGPVLDVLGYVPLDSDENFDFLATMGAVFEKAHLTITDAGKKHTYDHSSFGARFGIGFQYNMSQRINVRTVVRYQLISHNMGAEVPGNLVRNGFWTTNFGLNIQF